MSDEWEPRRPAAARHELGAELSAVSVDELRERIALLRDEIARLEAEVARKLASRDAVAGAFRF